MRRGSRGILPWQLVDVSGPSMVPTLRDGDRVLVWRAAAIRPGDVVLATFRSLPDRLVLKRAVSQQDAGWWLRSDNSFAGGDSDVHGVADAQGRVTYVRHEGRWSRVERR